jgi:hypothetical protein
MTCLQAKSSSHGGLLLGGFFLTRPAIIPKLQRIPANGFLTVSKCLAEFVPDDWAYMSSDQKSMKAETAKAFGIAANKIDQLTIWCTSQFTEKKTLGWPNVIFDIETARELVKRFCEGPTPPTLLGIGLPFEMSGQFFESSRSDTRSSSDEVQGVPMALQRGLILPEEGDLLGFEALGYRSDGSFHSSKCYRSGSSRLHDVRFNDFGYCMNMSDALLLCKIHSENTAEQIVWLPWEIRKYGL